MRVIQMLIIALTITFISNLWVFSHSGRTDSFGGHRDLKNISGLGAYHYHCGGYPAHLHYNDICPYTDDDYVNIVKSIVFIVKL